MSKVIIYFGSYYMQHNVLNRILKYIEHRMLCLLDVTEFWDPAAMYRAFE